MAEERGQDREADEMAAVTELMGRLADLLQVGWRALAREQYEAVRQAGRKIRAITVQLQDASSPRRSRRTTTTKKGLRAIKKRSDSATREV